MAEAQGLDRKVSDVLDAEQLQHGPGSRPLVLSGSSPVEQVLPEGTSTTTGPLGHEEVVARRHLREQLDALEGSAHAQPGPAVDGEAALKTDVRR